MRADEYVVLALEKSEKELLELNKLLEQKEIEISELKKALENKPDADEYEGLHHSVVEIVHLNEYELVRYGNADISIWYSDIDRITQEDYENLMNDRVEPIEIYNKLKDCYQKEFYIIKYGYNQIVKKGSSTYGIDLQKMDMFNLKNTPYTSYEESYNNAVETLKEKVKELWERKLKKESEVE